ncbi:hypothetical protein TNCV_21611 [Trichonephila clavipes]|nr:hypothetical protein TNCV_21611 [Trichonephila clavipes]
MASGLKLTTRIQQFQKRALDDNFKSQDSNRTFGAPLDGAIVTETSQFLSVSKGTVSKIMTQHTHSSSRHDWSSKVLNGKRSSVKENETGIEEECNG